MGLSQTALEAAVARSRSHAAVTLTSRATVVRPSSGEVDALGFQLPGMTTVASGVPCRVRQLTTREASNAARTKEEGSAVILFAFDQDVQETDTITVDGITYQATGAVQTSLGVHRQVTVVAA